MLQDIVEKLKKWAETNESVKAVILTSSRANGSSAPVDQFSDYDICVYVDNLKTFENDDWLSTFGDVLVCWPLKPQSTFDKNWLTRLVLFKDRLRIDFQITTNKDVYPTDYDLGYQVLVDKVCFSKDFPIATKSKHFIKKPTQEEFTTLINDFFWDATYVVKYLRREDLFYAKFMFDSALRFEYLEKMIEWHIGSQHDWKVSTNVHGRYFAKYLDQSTLTELNATFAGADLEENWAAFFEMVKQFTKVAKQLAKDMGYEYPTEQEAEMIEYYRKSKSISK